MKFIIGPILKSSADLYPDERGTEKIQTEEEPEQTRWGRVILTLLLIILLLLFLFFLFFPGILKLPGPTNSTTNNTIPVDFSLAINPSSNSAVQGSQATATVNASGIASSISLSISNCPPSATYTLQKY